jgi:diketogulonate reductase-like aldo/keto reductase
LFVVRSFIDIILYCLGDIVVTTTGKRERLEDFLKILDENFQLSDEDIQAIDEAGAKLYFRKSWTKLIDGDKEEL